MGILTTELGRTKKTQAAAASTSGTWILHVYVSLQFTGVYFVLMMHQCYVFLSLSLFFRLLFPTKKSPKPWQHLRDPTPDIWVHSPKRWITMDLWVFPGLSNLFGLRFGYGASYNFGPEDHGTDGASPTPPCHWGIKVIKIAVQTPSGPTCFPLAGDHVGLVGFHKFTIR